MNGKARGEYDNVDGGNSYEYCDFSKKSPQRSTEREVSV
jgi:hypothetical protein